jgi:hypothetical protein
MTNQYHAKIGLQLTYDWLFMRLKLAVSDQLIKPHPLIENIAPLSTHPCHLNWKYKTNIIISIGYKEIITMSFWF